MKFICCSIVIRNKHASFARFVHIRMLFYVIFLFRVNYSVILLLCVLYFSHLYHVLIILKFEFRIRILGAAVRLRNIILRVIQTSHPACHPGVSMQNKIRETAEGFQAWLRARSHVLPFVSCLYPVCMTSMDHPAHHQAHHQAHPRL